MLSRLAQVVLVAVVRVKFQAAVVLHKTTLAAVAVQVDLAAVQVGQGS